MNTDITKMQFEFKHLMGILILIVLIIAFLPKGEQESETNSNREDIGKIACNLSNDKCQGTITNVKPCNTRPDMECYVIDLGEGYSRPVERPVDGTYAR